MKAEADRTEQGISINRGKGLDFRRRLSGVVSKPPYAANFGNGFVVSDKEKRGQRPL